MFTQSVVRQWHRLLRKAVGAPSLETGWGPGQSDLLGDNIALLWLYICPKELLKTNRNLNAIHWLFLIILLYSY